MLNCEMVTLKLPHTTQNDLKMFFAGPTPKQLTTTNKQSIKLSSTKHSKAHRLFTDCSGRFVRRSLQVQIITQRFLAASFARLTNGFLLQSFCCAVNGTTSLRVFPPVTEPSLSIPWYRTFPPFRTNQQT